MLKVVVCILSVYVCVGDGGLTGRIVGGHETSILKHPYQALIQYRGRQLCGGSIVSPSAIITAAHCVYGRNYTNLEVRVGSDIIGQGILFQIAEVIVHDKFYEKTVDNDIAILILEKNLSFEERVQAITIPDSSYPLLPNSIVTLTGWGAVQSSGKISEHLREVTVPIVDHTICASRYEKFREVTPNMFCGGLLDIGGQDSCQGDSGGPVVQDDLLVGVISWGAGCGGKHFPGVYTSIPQMREWIRLQLNI